jgi:hypothetical protein
MYIFHRLPPDDPDWSMSTKLSDLFPTAVEAITAYFDHRLFVTEIQHPLEDPISGTPVVDPDCITEAIYSQFGEIESTPHDRKSVDDEQVET